MSMTGTRVHLMAARDDVLRVGDGHAGERFAFVTAHIDRAPKGQFPHRPATWERRRDENGRRITACEACGTSWYAPEWSAQQVPYGVARQHAAYMASLELRLQARTVEHGFAYVTSLEGERLAANELFQPGHTVHRFSTWSEDRSDTTAEDLAQEADFENEGAPPRATGDDPAPCPVPPRRAPAIAMAYPR